MRASYAATVQWRKVRPYCLTETPAICANSARVSGASRFSSVACNRNQLRIGNSEPIPDVHTMRRASVKHLCVEQPFTDSRAELISIGRVVSATIM